MNDAVSDTACPTHTGAAKDAVIARLSRLDQFLPVWIILAMAVGLVLGRTWTDFIDAPDPFKVGFGADCDRTVGDDVSGAGKGPIQRDFSDHR